MITEIIIFLITFLFAYVTYLHVRIQNKFKRDGVKYLNCVPFFGNLLKSTLFNTHLSEDFNEVYRAFPGERYVGFIDNMHGNILVRDPEIIKNITVKDFDHFVNHKQLFPEEVEPLFGGSVLMMQDERWRDMRTTLSPAFTGSKMRHMVPFMTKICNNIIQYLKENPSEEAIDIGEVIRRYMNDVIASAGFGLEVNSVKDKDNKFYMLGQSLFQLSTMQRIAFLVANQWPKLAKKLGLRIFSKESTKFFRDLVSSTIEYREKNNVNRPDMVHLLMEASKGTLKNNNEQEEDNVGFATVQEALKSQESNRKWSLDELSSQVFIFFVAGFESSASSLTMCVHELALNPDIEEKLYQEVNDFRAKNGTLNYDNINDLKYMDCVLNEALRKWSAAAFLDRVCSKPYELPPPRKGGKPYLVMPGDVVYNMVNSLHMDPQYFPNPTKFDPDRFSDENKHKIKPFTFMPFGMGPRNCIGSRFALLETKILLYDLVSNFKIVKTPKTSDPIKLAAGQIGNLKADGGTWAKLEARNEMKLKM